MLLSKEFIVAILVSSLSLAVFLATASGQENPGGQGGKQKGKQQGSARGSRVRTKTS